MKFKKSLALIVLSIFTAVSAAGCSLSGSGKGETTDADAKDTAKTLNIAIQPSPEYTPLYIARDEGWLDEALKDYDIEIKWSEFESGPPENESFAAGQQDIGVMGNVPAISGIAAGQERTVIGISANGEKAYGIIVKADSNINTPEDLKGKRVGLVVGSISQNYLDTLLKAHNLTSNDVEILNLNFSEQIAAFESGQVDALSTGEPILSKLQASGSAKLIADGTGIFLGENVIVGRNEYLKANPTIIKIFLEQYARAAAEVKNNPEAVAQKYSTLFGLEKEEIVNIINNSEFPIDITEADIEDLQSTVDFLYDNELIEEKLDISSYIDRSYVDAGDVNRYLN